MNYINKQDLLFEDNFKTEQFKNNVKLSFIHRINLPSNLKIYNVVNLFHLDILNNNTIRGNYELHGIEL